MSKLENEYSECLSTSLLASMIEHGVEYCSDGLRDCDLEDVAGLTEELKFLKQEQDKVVN